VNGVPLNDPESHEVWWIDHPDLLASTAEVQLQRGVGSALYGAASVGGSVNLETSPFSETPRFSAATAYGSYETKRLMLEGCSGALANGWNLYGRYSRVESFGYREQSWSKLWSYALSARKAAGEHSVRLNLYGGPEETHLAYYGVPREFLDGRITGDRGQDRRVNFITYPNERDHFFEPHYELLHSWGIAPGVSFSQTLFWFDGKGYYDEQRFNRALAQYRLSPWATYDTGLFGADSLSYYVDADQDGVLDRDPQGRVTVSKFDFVRRRTVVNRHYGWIPRLRLEHPGGTLTVGGELRAHDGRHWGEVLSGNGLPPGTPPDHAYYDYHPRTLAGGLFLREEWSLAPALTATGDLAWRHQSYWMRDDRFDGYRFDQPYDFALPRLGLTYTPSEALTAFASWSQTRREPAFRDLYDAEGVGSEPMYRVRDYANGVFADPLIRPERVNAYELGGAWRGAWAAASANLFWMDFRDELVGGQYNTDLGYLALGNAARSVHRGVELAARAERELAGRLLVGLDANATLSRNRFDEFRETLNFDGAGADSFVTFRYDGNTIGGFPDLIANLAARATWRGLTLAAETQHAGRIYVDNAEENAASVAPRTVLNLVGGVRVPFAGESQAELSLRVNNVGNAFYETGGYSYYDEYGNKYAEFVPAATRNWLAQVRVEF
jgi:iron complex outermembrane receptor protein